MKNYTYSEAELIAAIRRVAAQSGGAVSGPAFKAATGIERGTVAHRFGGWLKALAAAGVASPYRFGGTWFTCPICAGRFRSDNGAKSRRYCSRTCALEGKRRRVSKGRAASRQAARGRARYVVEASACAECGHDGSRYQVEVHHRDCDPYNNTPENLEPLCFPCHRRRHGQSVRAGKVTRRRGLAEETAAGPMLTPKARAA